MATVIAEVRSAQALRVSAAATWACSRQRSPTPRAPFCTGKWFHGGYLADVFAPGQKVALFGKVEFDTYSGELAMLHPEFEILSGDEDGDAALHTGPHRPDLRSRRQRSPRAFSARWCTAILREHGPVDDPLPAQSCASN